jgi:choline dehydrogenase-like flavoprotein
MIPDQKPQSTSTFDYVVVGTGAAGSIVSARLSEDPGITICALESGPTDRHPYIHIPAGFIKIMFNEAYTWQFKTEPSPHVNGRSVIIPVGRTVGGSSSINGLIINRGQAGPSVAMRAGAMPTSCPISSGSSGGSAKATVSIVAATAIFR